MKFVLTENCQNTLFGDLEKQQKLVKADYKCEIQLSGRQLLITINKPITDLIKVIEFTFTAQNTE